MKSKTRTLHIGPGKAISRRSVLRGAGAALALPLLDAMTPAFAQGGAAAPIHRFQTVYVPNGMAMDYWTPTSVGSDYELTPIVQPLAPAWATFQFAFKPANTSILSL